MDSLIRYFVFLIGIKHIVCEEFPTSDAPQDIKEWKGVPSVSASFKIPKNDVASTSIQSSEDWDALMKNGKTMVIGFFSDWKGVNGQIYLKTAVKRATDENIEWRFAHCQDEAIIEEYGDGSVIMFRPAGMANEFEESVIRYENDGEWKVQHLSKWIDANFFGKCPIATNQNFKDLPRPVAIVFYDLDFENNPTASQEIRLQLLTVTQKMKSVTKTEDGLKVNESINVAVANPAHLTKAYPMLSSPKLANVDTSKPFMVIYDKAGKQFVMEESVTLDGPEMANFISQYIMPTEKNEPLSDDYTDPSIKDEL